MSWITFCSLFLTLALFLTVLGDECTWRFRSHPEDCGSFLVCDYGAPVLQRCPRGLHWNQRIQTCDWTRNARCVSIGDHHDNSIHGETLLDRVSADDSCNELEFRPHESDCSSYYVCNHGSLLEMKCTQPLVWNPKINSCDWPGNVPSCSSDGGGSGPIPPPTTSTLSPAWVTPSTVGPPAPPPEEETGGGPPAPPPTRPPRPTTTTQGSGEGGDSTIVGIITGPSDSDPEFDSDVNIPDPDYKVVCYYTGWSWYRPGEGKFGPQNVIPDLCTHYVYAFAVLDSNTWTIKPADSWVDIDNKFYSQMTALKAQGRKVSIALGGWNDSEGQKYSLLLRDPAKIQSLINSVVEFCKTHDFDGIDLDYEYPVCPHGECHDDFKTDRNGFTILVKGLRAALPPGSLISAAVSANREIIDKAYDVLTMAETLNWIGVMDYDIHGSWEKQTGHIAPLYHHPDDTKDYLNVNYSIHHWIEKGAPPSKLVMGVPLYGQAFTLQDSASKHLNAPARGPGTPGKFSRQGGILAYYEICSDTWPDRVDDPEGRMGPFLVKGDQWVSYDDVDFIKTKMAYVKQLGLGGAMAWALDFDDFNNKCGHGRYPLIKAMKNGLSTKGNKDDGIY